MDELITNVHLRLQTFMFFLVFLSRLINQKSVEMKRNCDRRKFVKMKIRHRERNGYVCVNSAKEKATIFVFNNEFLNTDAIVFLIINILNNARVFFAPSMRI